MENSASQIKTPRVSRGLMRKSLKLLHMEYKPSELADELGINPKTIYRTWLEAGLPFRRDKSGHVWIVGTEARAWVEKMTTKRKGEKQETLELTEAFCLTCNQKVELKEYVKRRVGNTGQIKGPCPSCRRELRRFVKLTDLKNL